MDYMSLLKLLDRYCILIKDPTTLTKEDLKQSNFINDLRPCDFPSKVSMFICDREDRNTVDLEGIRFNVGTYVKLKDGKMVEQFRSHADLSYGILYAVNDFVLSFFQ